MPESLSHFIARQILSYPEVTENRSDVLHEAMCVFPTAFAWSNGVLTDYSQTVKPWKPLTFDQWLKWEYVPATKPTSNPVLARINMRVAWEDAESKIPYYEAIVENAQELATVNDGLRSNDYPYGHPKHVAPTFARQNALAPLMSAPNWIADEWEEAYEMMRYTASQHGWNM